MNPNNYENLKLRGLRRKYEAILMRGGKCEKCGYNKNLSALEFHHLNPDEKSFLLDMRHFSNNNLEVLKKELEKCKLLCSNCHKEIHNSEYELENVKKLLDNSEEKLTFSNKKYKHFCKKCGKPIINYTTGKIYCSEECKWNDKGYPSIEEVNEQYEILKSWEKVAQHFNLTRKIILGIRKRNS